ncbi:MAG: glycosyltransferase, partial [Actinobacteria bacterium]|nr:glycosyltransferase [Actinomycetota bacterium]
MSRVVVIVPVLNEEDSIEELITSLAGQTRPPDEIVIGDGGSTDRTLNILEQLQGTIPRLRIVTGAGGIAENRNAAIAATDSEVVACT